MELRLLTAKQVQIVYSTYMCKDFPPNELKPLAMILKAVDSGIYRCYGLFNDYEMTGYMFLEKLKESEDYLIDYLAVRPDMRNKGVGAEMIKCLSQILEAADSIIGEVENPDFAEDADEKKLQERRYNFYIRNGFRDTSVRVTCFGVHYIIIEMGSRKCNSADEIRGLYQKQYSAVLPKMMYDNNIFID